MCGIIAVVRRPDDREPTDPAQVRSLLGDAAAAVDGLDPDHAGVDLAAAIGLAAEHSRPWTPCSVAFPASAPCSTIVSSGPTPSSLAEQVEAAAETVEAALDEQSVVGWSSAETEQINAALIRVKDAGLGHSP